MNYINKKQLKNMLDATIRNCNLIISNSDSSFRQAYYRGQKELCRELLETLNIK